MARQLAFHLPSQPALGRGDFLVSPANAAAVEAIQSWHGWPQGKLVLAGPRASGKTHLAHVFATLCHASLVEAGALPGADLPALARGAVAVEDADAIAGNRAAEEALFHLHNMVLAAGHPLLITAAAPPSRWGLGLPDLASRMLGSALVTLGPPDDALLAALLVKLFADRQIAVEANLIDYLVPRIERSFAAAAATVATLDALALAEKRPVTRDLARRVLDISAP